MSLENESLTEYEPFSDDEIVKIEDDLILKIKSDLINITNKKTNDEENVKETKPILPNINKKQIKRKLLLRIISK